MRTISTKVIIDIESLAVLHRESYEYSGPVDRLCGGDALAQSKKDAAAQALQSQKDLTKIATDRNAVQQPFETNLVKNGLDYLPQLLDYNNGTVAQSFKPAEADLNRRISSGGSALPDGFATQSRTDLESNKAKAFDQTRVAALQSNEQAKEGAAAQLNPLGYYGSAGSSGSSVLTAPPVQSSGLSNIFGGALAGLLGNPSTSFGSGSAWSL